MTTSHAGIVWSETYRPVVVLTTSYASIVDHLTSWYSPVRDLRPAVMLTTSYAGIVWSETYRPVVMLTTSHAGIVWPET